MQKPVDKRETHCQQQLLPKAPVIACVMGVLILARGRPSSKYGSSWIIAVQMAQELEPWGSQAFSCSGPGAGSTGDEDVALSRSHASWASLAAQLVKNLPVIQETLV